MDLLNIYNLNRILNEYKKPMFPKDINGTEMYQNFPTLNVKH